MSHSKVRKRGKSLYLDKWNKRAKKWVVQCVHCGFQGHSLAILEPDFADTHEKEVIRGSLRSVLAPLELDAHGRCPSCTELQS